jgi:hypothetical protein
VLALVATLKPPVGQIAQLTREVAHAVRAHPDGPIFLSFFRRPAGRTLHHPRSRRVVRYTDG